MSKRWNILSNNNNTEELELALQRQTNQFEMMLQKQTEQHNNEIKQLTIFFANELLKRDEKIEVLSNVLNQVNKKFGDANKNIDDIHVHLVKQDVEQNNMKTFVNNNMKDLANKFDDLQSMLINSENKQMTFDFENETSTNKKQEKYSTKIPSSHRGYGDKSDFEICVELSNDIRTKARLKGLKITQIRGRIAPLYRKCTMKNIHLLRDNYKIKYEVGENCIAKSLYAISLEVGIDKVINEVKHFKF